MQVLTLVLIPLLCSAFPVKDSNPIAKLGFGKNSRIIGGQIAEPGFAPYQVSIQTLSFEHICGGSIISDRYILTAAHCIKSYVSKNRKSQLQIATGTNRYEEPGGLYFVENLVLHYNYGSKLYHNDIGLIRTNESIVFDTVTQPILLPSKPLQEGDEVVLTGWGYTDLESDVPDDLQKISLNFLSHKKCQKALDYNPGLDVGHICTYTQKGEGSCYGDSGSPLVKDGCIFGVVNWGFPCATGKPDAQASVYFYKDWIMDQMNNSFKRNENKL